MNVSNSCMKHSQVFWSKSIPQTQKNREEKEDATAATIKQTRSMNAATTGRDKTPRIVFLQR